VSWSLKPLGSWGAATSSAPATDFPAVKALPGTWGWFPGDTTLLVRKDQWGALLAAPAVTSISPTTGSVDGGTGLTISGSGFIGATGVTVGGTAATGFLVNDDSTVTCITPAHAAGAVPVVVLSPRGNATAGESFEYA
jgi:hypothetical protein